MTPASDPDRNIVYGMYGGAALLLDVHRPVRPNGFAVIDIPGNGFQAPHAWSVAQLKNDPRLTEIERPLLEAGFTVFTINYRSAPRFRFPAPVEDVQLAARFVRANATIYGVRGDWLGVLGASAGGTLAATLATQGEGSPDDQPGATSRVAARIARPDCVVAAMPATDLIPLGTDSYAAALVTQYLGYPPAYPGTDAAEARVVDRAYLEASPINFLSRATSPMLVLHGDKDQLVPLAQSQAFLARAKAVGAPVELILMPGEGHAFHGRWPGRAADWLKACLGRTRPAGGRP